MADDSAGTVEARFARLELSTGNVQFMLLNQGTGPARITAMRVAIDGAPVRSFGELHKVAGFHGSSLVQTSLSSTVVPAVDSASTPRPIDECPIPAAERYDE